LYQQGFLIPAPDAPWIECLIVDVSDSRSPGGRRVGRCRVFGLAFTAGEVLRVCSLVWCRGERVGAGFIGAKELWKDFEATAEPRLQQVSSSYPGSPQIPD
jgi:hypothetical protein